MTDATPHAAPKTEADWIAEAVALSATALDRPGTEPFGALVVRDGEVVGRGLNHSRANMDPTSHGETEAIRDACRVARFRRRSRACVRRRPQPPSLVA